MAKAGIQQMSLPDIYTMFKTASDEDKIKLMNTYANLGERLGEYDKDIDYRRTRGYKDALNEKMYTEGIGDVLGSAWDYTKQGAETAWDYTKQGAESLRDLVMGEQASDEEQLPVNDTQLPWESEGNAFVGSKEDADIDPLVGMSRDPGMSLFEAVNEPQNEPETLSPQEQRFLGADSAEEQVVESPMARRARERLEKLTAQQEQYAANPDDRWSELYNIDPERAMFDYGREKDRLDFLIKAASGTQESPEKIIRMLQTEINRTTRNRDKAIEDYGANSIQAQRYNNLLKELEIEMNSDSPSVRNAYARSGEQPPPEASGLDGAEDIKNMIRDAKFSDIGLLVGRDDIASAIEDWRVKNGVSVQDPTYKSLMKTLDDKEKSKDKQYIRTDAEQKEFDKMEEKYKKLYTYSRNTPEATWQKAQLLNIVLRDETGAAIAADEARDLALVMLPDDNMRNEFISRWDSAISNAIENMDSVKDAVKITAAANGNLPWSEVAGLGSLLEEIKGKMSGKKLQEYARSAIPTSYLKAKDQENKGKKPEPNRTIPPDKKLGDIWSDENYYYRLNDNNVLQVSDKE